MMLDALQDLLYMQWSVRCSMAPNWQWCVRSPGPKIKRSVVDIHMRLTSHFHQFKLKGIALNQLYTLVCVTLVNPPISLAQLIDIRHRQIQKPTIKVDSLWRKYLFDVKSSGYVITMWHFDYRHIEIALSLAGCHRDVTAQDGIPVVKGNL